LESGRRKPFKWFYLISYRNPTPVFRKPEQQSAAAPVALDMEKAEAEAEESGESSRELNPAPLKRSESGPICLRSQPRPDPQLRPDPRRGRNFQLRPDPRRGRNFQLRPDPRRGRNFRLRPDPQLRPDPRRGRNFRLRPDPRPQLRPDPRRGRNFRLRPDPRPQTNQPESPPPPTLV